jgi:hypothetical protein
VEDKVQWQEYLGLLNDYKLYKKDPAPWTFFYLQMSRCSLELVTYFLTYSMVQDII